MINIDAVSRSKICRQLRWLRLGGDVLVYGGRREKEEKRRNWRAEMGSLCAMIEEEMGSLYAIIAGERKMERGGGFMLCVNRGGGRKGK